MVSINQMLVGIPPEDLKRMCKIHGVHSWQSISEDEDGDSNAVIATEILEENRPPPHSLTKSIEELKQMQHVAAVREELRRSERDCAISNDRGYVEAVRQGKSEEIEKPAKKRNREKKKKKKATAQQENAQIIDKTPETEPPRSQLHQPPLLVPPFTISFQNNGYAYSHPQPGFVPEFAGSNFVPPFQVVIPQYYEWPPEYIANIRHYQMQQAKASQAFKKPTTNNDISKSTNINKTTNKLQTVTNSFKNLDLARSSQNSVFMSAPSCSGKKQNGGSVTPNSDGFVKQVKTRRKKVNKQNVENKDTIIGANSFSLLAPSSDTDTADNQESENEPVNVPKTQKNKKPRKTRGKKKSITQSKSKANANKHFALHETEDRFVLQHLKNKEESFSGESDEDIILELPPLRLERRFRIIHHQRGMEQFEIEDLIRNDVMDDILAESFARRLGLPFIPNFPRS